MTDAETRKIPLTQGQFAIVDLQDYDALSAHKWGFHKDGYASRVIYWRDPVTNAKCRKTIMMQWTIADPQPGERVDHINGNRLDNRRSNLRCCSHAQNCQNRHAVTGRIPYKGVDLMGPSYKGKKKPFRARIRVSGRSITIGYFATAEEAASAYNDAAVRHFGEFASPNVIGVCG